MARNEQAKPILDFLVQTLQGLGIVASVETLKHSDEHMNVLMMDGTNFDLTITMQEPRPELVEE